jgi:Fe-S cluster biogenesis protein NfuA
MRELVEKILERVRPHLRVDGADIELIDVSEEEGIVKLKLTGGCCNCPFSQMALHAGLESTLKDSVSGVKSVLLVRA